MTKENHQLIRSKMRDCHVWDYVEQLKVYTVGEFIKNFGDKMPNDLIELLKNNINRLQCCLDERILEPIN